VTAEGGAAEFHRYGQPEKERAPACEPDGVVGVRGAVVDPGARTADVTATASLQPRLAAEKNAA